MAKKCFLKFKLSSAIAAVLSLSTFSLILVLGIAISQNFLFLAFTIGLLSFALGKKVLDRSISNRIRLSWIWIPILLLIGLSKMNTFGNFRSGYDPVQYVLMAHEINRNNSFEFPDQLAKDTSPTIQMLSRENLNSSVVESKAGFLNVNFYPLFPTLMAYSMKVFGPKGFIFVTPFVFMLSLFIVGSLLTILLKSQMISLIFITLFSFNPVIAFGSQWTITEPLAFLFSSSGALISLILIKKSIGWKTCIALLTPIFLSLFLTRMNFVQSLLAISLLLIFEVSRNSKIKFSTIFWIILCNLLAILLALSFYYFFQNPFFHEMLRGTFLYTLSNSVGPKIFLGIFSCFTLLVFLRSKLNFPSYLAKFETFSNLVLYAVLLMIGCLAYLGDNRFQFGKFSKIDFENIFVSIGFKLLIFIGPAFAFILFPIPKNTERHILPIEKQRYYYCVLSLSAFILLQSLFSNLIPDGYYYSRYLYTEIVPLTLLSIALLVCLLRNSSPILSNLIFALTLGYSLIFTLPTLQGSEGESDAIYKSIEQAADRRIVLVTDYFYLVHSLNHIFGMSTIQFKDSKNSKLISSILTEFEQLNRPEPMIVSDLCRLSNTKQEHGGEFRHFPINDNSSQSDSVINSIFRRLPPLTAAPHKYKLYSCNLSSYLKLL